MSFVFLEPEQFTPDRLKQIGCEVIEVWAGYFGRLKIIRMNDQQLNQLATNVKTLSQTQRELQFRSIVQEMIKKAKKFNLQKRRQKTQEEQKKSTKPKIEQKKDQRKPTTTQPNISNNLQKANFLNMFRDSFSCLIQIVKPLGAKLFPKSTKQNELESQFKPTMLQLQEPEYWFLMPKLGQKTTASEQVRQIRPKK